MALSEIYEHYQLMVQSSISLINLINADSILGFPFFIDLKSVPLIFVSSETKYTKIQLYQEKLLHR